MDFKVRMGGIAGGPTTLEFGNSLSMGIGCHRLGVETLTWRYLTIV